VNGCSTDVGGNTILACAVTHGGSSGPENPPCARLTLIGTFVIVDCIGRAAVGDPRESWTDGASDTGNGFQPILSWGSAAVALRTNRNTRGTTKGRRERTVRYNTRNTKAVQSQIDKPSMVYRRGVYHPLRLCDDVILKICSGHAYSLHEPMVIMARMPTGE